MLKKLKDQAKEKSMLSKMIITAIVVAFTAVNIILLGAYMNKGPASYAAGIDLSVQDNSTTDSNVKFSLSFDQSDETKNSVSKDINVTDLVLYAKISLQNGGYLKEGQISFGNTNFKLAQDTNLKFNMIQSGEGQTIAIPIAANKDGNMVSVGLLDMVSSINLNAVYHNNKGQDVNVTATKGVKVAWDASGITQDNNPVYINNNVITNKVYPINGVNKRVVQVLVNSGITGNIYPLKETDIEIKNPVLADNAAVPEEVYVSTYGANATNGTSVLNKADSIDANSSNVWAYDGASVNVKLTNVPDSNNNISWNKSGEDQIVVTYIYEENVDVSAFTSAVNNKVTLYDSSSTVLTANSEVTPDMTKELSAVTTFSVAATPSIYKSNLQLGNNVYYAESWKINVSYPDVITGGVYAGDVSSVFSTGVDAYSVYKNLSINKAEFVNLLGEAGSIDILNNADDSLITSITTNANTDESGNNLVFTYPDGISSIRIKTSNPTGSGNLNIANVKELTPNGMTAKQIADIENMQNSANEYAGMSDGVNSNVISGKADIQIKTPVTSASLDMNTKSLATANPTNVTFTVTLNSNDVQYNLFNNPTFNIVLPNEVTGITINNAVLLSGGELTLGNVTADGNTVTVPLSGVQTAYNGTNPVVSIDMTITSNPYIPTTEDAVQMNYTNGGENLSAAPVAVTFESQPGLLLVNSIKNGNSTITAFQDNKVQTGSLSLDASMQTASVVGKLINNTGADAADVTILGTIPSAGDKLDGGLVTTIDTVMASPVIVSNS
ncbi:MAG: hypothetical protein FWC53_03485, partial [Firmicutes bacterium]|nr:hypothetical protein [Bacillota bacterium]